MKKSGRRQSSSSQRWVNRQSSDVYVKKARDSGQRSRAVYKLEQLDQRDRLFKPGQVVVDLGASPGGWSQYLARRLGDTGRVLAIDLLAMEPLAGVEFIQGNFLEQEVRGRIQAVLGERLVDAVVSDMAPNLSGIRDRDEAMSETLHDAALSFTVDVLRPGGLMVVKVFEGRGRADLVARARSLFSSVVIRKPDASRSASPECYMVAKGYNRPIREPLADA
ncbi:MAG: ribosomal RNA large subunit methyltransferase E [marine bacterium B5-7]|nr:MAG: ribosomal RNA large subunit methyltransferase E [marine bacterium B5-7]